MSTLDNINLFAVGGATDDTQDPLYPEYLALVEQFEAMKDMPTIPGGYPDAPSFAQFKRQKEAEIARNIMAENLESGDIKKAYEEGFTQLPFLEQMGAYVNPVTGIPIETYETGYFADEAGFGLKSPKEFAMDVLNPTKNIFQKTPIKAEDPMSAILAPLSAAGAIGGLGDLANIPKAGLMALKRYQAKTMDGGGGGISGLPPTTFKEDIQKYATYDGFVSPTYEALITKAPKNLKGQGIVDWMKANAGKGVKPKEVKYLGIQEYIDENPNATVRDVIEKTSGNKIEIGTQTYTEQAGEKPYGFYEEIAYSDPLDGSDLYQYRIDDLKDSVNRGDFWDTEDLVADYEQRLSFAERQQYGDTFKLEDMIDRINKGQESGASSETLDDVIEDFARKEYEDNPYGLILPSGDGIDSSVNRDSQAGYYDTFAIGNEDSGYTVFVNGERIDTGAHGSFSSAQAEMDLEDAMRDAELLEEFYSELGAKHKGFIDENMPGGKNYEEKVYTWDNTSDYHDVLDDGHYDVDNQIASAIMRDRLLEDGTASKHADEIQSDLHAEGYKKGYKDPVNDPIELEKIAEDTVDFNANVNNLIEKTKNDVERFKQQYPTALNTKVPYGDSTTYGDVIDMRFDELASLDADRGYGLQPRARNSAALTKIESILATLEAQEITALERQGIVVDRNEGLYRTGTEPGVPEKIFLDFHVKTKDSAYADYFKASDQNIDLLRRKKGIDDKIPDYPFKDDYYELVIKKMIKQAIDEDLPAVSVATSASMIDRWGRGPDDSYYKLYTNLYDKKIPSFMEKFAKKYDGVFEKEGSLDIDDIYGSGTTKFLSAPETGLDRRRNNAKANIIRITPQMRKKIIEEGLPSMYMGGKVTKSNSMDRPIGGNRREM